MVLLIGSIATVFGQEARESYYKLRIHKNFIKEIIDKNFKVVLQHIESQVDKDVYLTEINANINSLELKIQPVAGGDWGTLDSDLFFDQGQIVMELNNLEFAGAGLITDPQTGLEEQITVNAALDLAQLVLSLDQEITADGNLYPKIEVTEIAFTLHPEIFGVSVSGDLPLYRSREFEAGIRKWMASQIAQREHDFRVALQKSEREIMASFAFKQELAHGSTAHATLSETMGLDGDHVVISYTTVFEGPGFDRSSTARQMRTVDAEYSNEANFMRDVQVLVDENYLNYLLFNLFYSGKLYSVNEQLFKLMPDSFVGGGLALRAVMNSHLWAFLFPDLKYEATVNSQIDFKCGFSKEYLQEGDLEEAKISQVRFAGADTLEGDLHFGCGVYVREFAQTDDQLEALVDLLQSLGSLLGGTQDLGQEQDWSLFRRFFISVDFKAVFNFGDEIKKSAWPGDSGERVNAGVGMVFAKVVDFTATVRELAIYKGDSTAVRLEREAAVFNDAIQAGRAFMEQPEFRLLYDTFLKSGMPLVPFPAIQHCLGIDPLDSSL